MPQETIESPEVNIENVRCFDEAPTSLADNPVCGLFQPLSKFGLVRPDFLPFCFLQGCTEVSLFTPYVQCMCICEAYVSSCMCSLYFHYLAGFVYWHVDCMFLACNCTNVKGIGTPSSSSDGTSLFVVALIYYCLSLPSLLQVIHVRVFRVIPT